MFGKIPLIRWAKLDYSFIPRLFGTLYNETMPNQFVEQKFDYFLILDFEATCDKPQLSQMEIIEFPVLKFDCRTLEIVDIFHRYVKPTINPQLTPFCIELTGILQEMVDKSNKFTHVFNEFQQWLIDVNLIDQQQTELSKFAFVTCGDWDLKKILPLQCKYCNFEIPSYFRTWINIKKSFTDHKKHWPKSQAYLLEYFNIPPMGRAHSGIDDCHNLASIVRELIKDGCVFEKNSRNKD